jgi:guanylate kinase
VTQNSGAGAPRRGRLFVVSGPSGAGKGTLIQEVLKRRPEVMLSTSATTRPARAGEQDGVHYYFTPTETFRAMSDAGEFLEWAEVYGHMYGTPRQPVEQALNSGKDVMLELDIQGAVAVKRALPHAVLVFVEPPSFHELKARLRGRGTEDAGALGRRMQAAYEETKAKGLYDHILINDEIKRATEEFIRILDDHRDG